MKFLRKNRGFTLVEVLVGMALTGVVLLIAIQLSQSVLKSYTRTTDKVADATELQLAINWLIEDIECAKGKILIVSTEKGDTQELRFSLQTAQTDEEVGYFLQDKELHRTTRLLDKLSSATYLTNGIEQFLVTQRGPIIEVLVQKGNSTLKQKVTVFTELL